MRVALVCPYDLAGIGGVQQLVTDLAARLRSGGDEATVIGPVSAPVPGVVGVGRPTTVRANASSVPVALSPAAAQRVRAAVAGHDVVHLHEPLMPAVGWGALRIAPTVATFHADPARWTRRLYRAMAPLGARLLGDALLTAVSEVAASALPARWGPVEIVPNAIDVAAFRSPEPRRPGTVVFLGRDDPRKGLDVLLAAWPEVRRRRPDAELRVLGARRDGPIEGVRFLGVVDVETKRRELAGAAVYVAPNRSGESFGIVLLEAMAAGCRIVASDLPAFRAVAAGVAAFVPPGDAASIAGALGEALSVDPSLEEAERVRAAAAPYDWSVVTGRYRELYARAVEG